MRKLPMTRSRLIFAAGGVALTLPLAGCISVKTPEKPIEINLNVNIRQEVLVRLQKDVDTLINQNPEAFPQATPPRKP
jgi:hypothetical protein